MPIRWLISPVALRILVDPNDGAIEEVICPKEHTYIDPGRSKRYIRTSIIGSENWALSMVRGVDFTPLDADAEIIHLFEQNFSDADDLLSKTPSQLGWSVARQIRIRNRLTARGVDTTGLTASSPLIDWLRRIGQRIDVRFDPRAFWVRGP